MRNSWPLAKIAETHPAADGTVRVVTLKKAGGTTLKRSIHNLIPLPTEDKNHEDNQIQNISCNNGRIHYQPQRQKSNSTNGSKMLVTMMLLFVTIQNALAANFNVNYLKSGLYIEDIGHVKIERGLFRIDTKINKTKITIDMETASNAVQDFRYLCNNVTRMGENLCENLLHHLDEEEKHLNWTHQGLKTILHQRHKRGLLGNLLTSIFGVNDEVYRDIDTLEVNQKELIRASSHQTKFMLSALATINITEAKIYAHLERFRQKLDQGLQAMYRMERWFSKIDMNELNLHVLNSYHIVINILNEISDYYTKVMHITLNQGSLFDIISPASINQVITSANVKLPSNIQILQHPMIKTKVTLYLLIKVNTVPLKIEDTSYWILDVVSNVIAIDYNTQLYFQMSDQEFKQCIMMEETQYLCVPSSMKNIENSPNCVINEIYRRSEKTKCETREHAIKSVIWKQLYMKNTWMFISTKPFKVAVTCNGIREDVSLNTTGVIQISQECIITTKQSIITPSIDSSLTVLQSFNHPVNLSLHLSVPRSKMATETKEETVIKASDDLSKLIDEEKELHESTWHLVKHHSIVSSFTTTAIVLIAAILTWLIVRYCLNYRKKKNSVTKKSKSKETEEGIPLQTLGHSAHNINLEPIYADIHHRMNH